jgi:hypothetical protein
MRKFDNNSRTLIDYKGDRIPTFKSVRCEDGVFCLKKEAIWVPSKYKGLEDFGYWRHPEFKEEKTISIKWYNKGKFE